MYQAPSDYVLYFLLAQPCCVITNCLFCKNHLQGFVCSLFLTLCRCIEILGRRCNAISFVSNQWYSTNFLNQGSVSLCVKGIQRFQKGKEPDADSCDVKEPSALEHQLVLLWLVSRDLFQLPGQDVAPSGGRGVRVRTLPFAFSNHSLLTAHKR